VRIFGSSKYTQYINAMQGTIKIRFCESIKSIITFMIAFSNKNIVNKYIYISFTSNSKKIYSIK